MGTPIITELKPLPRPDPSTFFPVGYFKIVKRAHSSISSLKMHVETNIKTLERVIKEQGKNKLTEWMTDGIRTIECTVF